MWNVVTILLMVAAVGVMVRQVRKPSRGLGRSVLRSMNLRHYAVTTWGLSHVSIAPDFTILDVGCGGGKTVERLAAIASRGKVYGIDYSTESVAVAQRTNAAAIRSGRVDIRHGSVSHLPYPDASFDLVSAVETHYYWPDLVADLREVRRVLKPGGRIVLIAEVYKGDRSNLALAAVMKVIGARYFTLTEHHDLLAAAGFADISIFSEPRKGWVTAVGRNPGAAHA